MLNEPDLASHRVRASGWLLASLLFLIALPLQITAQTPPAPGAAESEGSSASEQDGAPVFSITTITGTMASDERRELPLPPAMPEPSAGFMSQYSLIWNGWALIDSDLFARTVLMSGTERILEARGPGIVSTSPPTQETVRFVDPISGEEVEGVSTQTGFGHPAMTEELLGPGLPYLWLIREGRAFVIRDEQVLADAREMLDAQAELRSRLLELGRQQLRIARQQEEISAEVGEAAARLGELGQQHGELAMRRSSLLRNPGLGGTAAEARIAELEDEWNLLGDSQRATVERLSALERELHELQQQQASLAEEQREVGARLSDAQEEVRQGMWQLVDRARQNGLAAALSASR